MSVRGICGLARQSKWDDAEALFRGQLKEVSIVLERLVAIDEARHARAAKLVQIDYDLTLNLPVALLSNLSNWAPPGTPTEISPANSN